MNFAICNFLLPTFSVCRKQDFQVANLPLATVKFRTLQQQIAANENQIHKSFCISAHVYSSKVGKQIFTRQLLVNCAFNSLSLQC